jgi:DNA-binding CsgD family transcriptional regulator
LHELALLRATSAGAPGEDRRLLALIDAECNVAWASAAAVDALGVTVGDRLPAPLARWLETKRAAERCRAAILAVTPRSANGQMRVDIDDTSFDARMVLDAYPQLDALHLTPLDDAPSSAALGSLGLTRRQADVLALALRGKTTRQIAHELVLSARTVEKHFEGIYTRFGAENRTQVIVAAMRAIRDRPQNQLP